MKKQRGGETLVAPLARRDFLKAGAATAAALLTSSCSRFSCAPAGSDGPLNLFFVFTDDQNADLMGYASNGRVKTPNLDALAKRGTIFDAAYANAIPCVQSRGSMLSGLYFNRWKRTSAHVSSRLVPGEWTWAHALRAAGYRTGLIGKMHLDPFRAQHGFEHAEFSEHGFGRLPGRGQPFEDDFDRWLFAKAGVRDWQNLAYTRALTEEGMAFLEKAGRFGTWPYAEDLHPISWIRERSIDFIDTQRRDSRPFALIASIRYPHSPHNPAQRFADLYDPADIELPADDWEDMRNIPGPFLDLVKRRRSEFNQTPDEIRHVIARNYALVTQIDAAVGSIMEHVDLSNTLFIFSSDHGDYLGRRGQWGKQPFVPFDSVARVPFFACGPGVPAGKIVSNPIGLVDVAPTFLRAAGREIPEDLDGVPLQNYFENPDYGTDRTVFCWGIAMKMVRKGRYKYLVSHSDPSEMLFDLKSDPDELNNLVGDPKLRPILDELRQTLAAIEAKPKPGLPRFEDAATA